MRLGRSGGSTKQDERESPAPGGPCNRYTLQFGDVPAVSGCNLPLLDMGRQFSGRRRRIARCGNFAAYGFESRLCGSCPRRVCGLWPCCFENFGLRRSLVLLHCLFRLRMDVLARIALGFAFPFQARIRRLESEIHLPRLRRIFHVLECCCFGSRNMAKFGRSP